MRHETKLLQLLSKLGYPKPAETDWHEFMRCKSYRLYDKFPEFKQFLDKHTSFLPSNVHATQRWLHFLNGDTQPHSCACGAYIKDYNDKYCSHKCSTQAPQTGQKRGPKVDLVAKAKELRASLPRGYSLVEYGRVRSTFKHSCGNVFEIGNRPLLTGKGKCSCLHKKLVKHDVATLQQWHDVHATGYTVLKLRGKEALLQCESRHVFVSRKFYNRRCPKCFTNIFASNVRTDAEYRQWLADNRAELKILGNYANVATNTLYLHTVCGKKFDAKPATVARESFRCPACAPKTCGSYREFKRGDVVLNVRGKEAIALDWILANTRYTLDDIVVDSEGLVPSVSYRQLSDDRTRMYHPDFYIKRSNLIVEVKDGRTLGLKHEFFYSTGTELFKQNCAKAKACIKAGYKFKLMLFDRNNKLVRLPSDWHTMSRSALVRLVKQRGVI